MAGEVILKDILSEPEEIEGKVHIDHFLPGVLEKFQEVLEKIEETKNN